MTPQPGTLSVQLYTFRDAYAAEPGGTIARIAGLGFRYLEPFGIASQGLTDSDKVRQAQALRRLLDSHGLSAPTAHAAAPLGPVSAAVLDSLEALGCRLPVISWPGEVPGFERDVMDTREGTERFADALNEASLNAASRGMELGYHNHWWEWSDVGGQHAYDQLLSQLDPAVFLEVDTYWAQTGGQDVAALLRRLGGRVKALHLKDGPATPEADQTPLGTGRVDYAAAIAAAPSARWHVLEMDRTAGDVFAEVGQSARRLIQEGLSTWD
ncbi:sugar phosphate isomerase/epimerase family protein [Deinococcus koreensis]|uniref:Sugar phosphate isomerase n=1 Tax=Deinococcus koreensis TaxID=2054903 RepID=A0A2K3UV38_9DEIO|nr:TIM barrel protein [Deinococcus koreensis]PNY80396.1 sugar phosphate isomerase [Deinococcus koreensis]